MYVELTKALWFFISIMVAKVWIILSAPVAIEGEEEGTVFNLCLPTVFKLSFNLCSPIHPYRHIGLGLGQG